MNGMAGTGKQEACVFRSKSVFPTCCVWSPVEASGRIVVSHVLPNRKNCHRISSPNLGRMGGTMKLTVSNVVTPALQGKAEAIHFDDDVPGFGIRIRAGGSKHWIFQYRVGKKQRRLTLGKVSAVSLVNARKTASELHAKVRLG